MNVQELLAVFSGLIVGTSLALTGGGGSLFAIPLLVYVVGVPVQHATIMSLIVVGYASLFGAWRKSREGLVRGRAALLFGGSGMGGSWIGAQGHDLVDPQVILLLFGMLMVGVSFSTWRRADVESSSPPSAPGCAEKFSAGCAWRALLIGFGVGLLTGFFGIGGGFVIVPALLFILGFPMAIAIGTALLIIAITSVGGIIGHLQMSDHEPTLTVLVIGGSLLGMIGGGLLSKRLNEHTLTTVFALLFGATGLFLIIHNGLTQFG